ncbi:cupredoxin domain-containing protein [Paenibacillus alginolyticus]|uniref:Cupredoxin domain-containing protein n=1 Tax=Paenibacillus alginolyticus TaxID=59839 RepID=A0ABT4GB16_9BACL|nr:cupredoxin domain-containing protein [Paenibacillus alginolyticus]MCY9693376.1 cupredoxin domain-containing protein [Paenibacillus alginolyticus]MEC0144635.1 cupredoxin domain-containing protein [Paenibacillus alginolyticus]
MGYATILILFASLSTWIVSYLIAFRKSISCMAGMMTAMALGMSIGLGVGSLMALLIPGQFFQSTMISMLIGGTIGVAAGITISLMAVIDGLMSGLMGGMMGTMLIIMIPSPYVGLTIKIMSILCSGIIFLLLLMLQGEVKADVLNRKFFLLSKPSPMFCMIVIVLVLLQLPVFGKTQSMNPMAGMGPTSTSQDHVHNQTSQETNPLDKPDKVLLVKAAEYSFTPSSIRIIAGQKIQLVLDNTGQVEHDFEISGTNVHIHAAPGKKSEMIVSLDKAGYYQVICTLPGHKDAGMSASIQVTKS